MKRPLLFTIAVLCLGQAQASRDDYRAAYKAWRETDPKLEQESAAGGMEIAQQADRMAAEAAKVAAARKAYLEAAEQDQKAQISWLSEPPAAGQSAAASSAFEAQFTTNETTQVSRNVDTFANNPDPGLQQLRGALMREKAALASLEVSIGARKKAADTADEAIGAITAARMKVLDQSNAMLEGLKDAATDADREGAAWAEYYRKLGEGAQGAAAPITEVAPGAPPATLNNPIAAPATVTPLPLARYTGSWAFPQSNGLFHGSRPQSIDLLVNDENGHVNGTVVARFVVAAGHDPALRLSFSGEWQATRNQVFSLVTSDGTKGRLELIPGAAFNLIEVNFETDADAGKVTQADAVLVKK